MDNATNKISKSVAIIGGGAAGLMSAYHAKLNHPDYHVSLYEKNAYVGAKVIISGGGRCNVTTGILDLKKVLQNYPRGAEFLRTAMQNFPPEAVISWFESQGVPLKTEEDLRVFPISNNGKHVVGALENALQELGVEIHCNTHITEISKTSAGFLIETKAGPKPLVDTIILTTGGNAYRQTGSTGDGYAFAKNLGHTITELAPSLSNFHIQEKWAQELSGISFKKAKLTFISADHQDHFERTGPFLFTHKGVSGPAIFALSGMAAYQKFDTSKPAHLQIDFFPDQNSEKLDQQLQELFQTNPGKKITNIIALLLPSRLAENLTQLAHLPENLTPANLSKSQRHTLLNILKSTPLQLIGRGAGDEFVTAGGVPLSEVDHQTMQSKICPGLFFAGEILDIDGFTGGFNLQASWATGALAGESI
ncbi:NAD(P)/FAD-dependent oxidoreductase [Candidatus Peregrinibacteria bacterium]|nr:NAD(P)/FAD-dependent oxidoreductase [Candidatus Peregrinibacteria bacterium]